MTTTRIEVICQITCNAFFKTVLGPGQIDNEIVRRTHFGGFDDEGDEDGEEVCSVNILELPCLIGKNIARQEKEQG